MTSPGLARTISATPSLTTSAPRPFEEKRSSGATLLWVQSAAAALIGMRVLPLPVSGSHSGHWVANTVACSFAALSALTARSLRQRSQEHRSRQQAYYLAFHDSCTQLPNRAAVEQVLHEWLRTDQEVSCFYLEVEGVSGQKHPQTASCADKLVQSIACRLESLLGPDDVLGQFTTDRFVILLPQALSRDDLTRFAEHTLEVMSPPHLLDSGPVTTSINIGIASSALSREDYGLLLAKAKTAMAAARSEERNNFTFAEDLCCHADTRNTMISHKLQRALLDNGLQLVYQPIYNKDEDMVAAEALLRWHDPEEGHITPGEFVPVAEATGLIVPLSNWVLRQACSQMVEWGDLSSSIERIAVNVSVKQVSRKDFIPTVRRILEETGLDAHRLELEVTEGALASDFESVNRHLQELRQLGVRISIDDFGTGYSSLSRVRELNADVLKIDRLFTQGASESEGGAAMVQAIIDMAHTLHLSVVAEGIETKDQMKILRGMQCDEMQGFLLARPRAAEVLTTELQRQAEGAHTPPPRRTTRLVPRMV